MIGQTRRAPITVAGLEALHGAPGVVEFVYACAAGRGFHLDDEGNPRDSTTRGSGVKWVGAIVTAKKRAEIRERLGFSLKTWNDNWRYRWEERGMSHRCSRGGHDALFFAPVDRLCLWCGGGLERRTNPSGAGGHSLHHRGAFPPQQGEIPVQDGDTSTRSEKKREMPSASTPQDEGDPFHRMRQAARQEQWEQAALVAEDLGEVRLAGFAKSAAARSFFDLLSIVESQARVA